MHSRRPWALLEPTRMMALLNTTFIINYSRPTSRTVTNLRMTLMSMAA